MGKFVKGDVIVAPFPFSDRTPILHSMLSTELEKAVTVWPVISNIVSVPRTEEEYQRAVALLDELIDHACPAAGQGWRR